MSLLKRYSLLFALLIFGCSNTIVDPTPIAEPFPPKPVVVSNNPTVTVKSWQYISPAADESLQSFPAQDSGAVAFGPDPLTAFVVWHNIGFDLIWGGFFCSTAPVIIIEEATIQLWPNDGIWEDCIASEEIHTISVTLLERIESSSWTVIYNPGDPPTNTADYTAVPTPLSRYEDAPFVESYTPEVIIKEWTYITPDSEVKIVFPPKEQTAVQLDAFLFYESYIVWRDGGFDLFWGEDVCIQKPAIVIDTVELATANLNLSGIIPATCDGVKQIHTFQVELETEISSGSWTYALSQRRLS